jgi:hypothetical protein
MAEVNVYCDEVIRPNKKDFLIMGSIFIEERDIKSILKELLKCRCLNPKCKVWHYEFESCPNKTCTEKLHKKNNTSIHFYDLRQNKERKKIALAWLNYLKRDYGKKIKFKLLVIDLKKLQCSYFGNNKTDVNIYNRFFRTLLKGGINYLFCNQHNAIMNVYHDEGSQKKHEYFPELNLKKLSIESPDFTIHNKNIIFVNSDHREYLKNNDMELANHSQVIQLVDIILGCFSQLLLNTSNIEDKKEVAESMRDYFTKIMNYGYFPSSINFFPKYTIEQIKESKQRTLRQDPLDLALSTKGNFYKEANLEMPVFLGKQKNLRGWFNDTEN